MTVREDSGGTFGFAVIETQQNCRRLFIVSTQKVG
jgi:hypothetical protein